MALRHLARTVSAPALRQALGRGPLVSPAAGARHLAYRSSQGKGWSDTFPEFEDFMKRPISLEERRRVFMVLAENRRKEIQFLHEEWDDFERVLRRDLQDLARFTKKVEKIVDVCTVVGVGIIALAVGARCLM